MRPVPRALILLFLVKPALNVARLSLTKDVPARNARWVALEHLLKDKRVFSVVPQVAFLTRTPPVTEPFLIRFLELGGRYDTGPPSDRIRAREFDLVVTLDQNYAYRGIELVSPSLQRAIRSAYAPFCATEQTVYHLPRDQRDSGSLRDGLLQLGCRSMRGS